MTEIVEHGIKPDPKKRATKEHFNGPDIPFEEVIKAKSRSQPITFRQQPGGLTLEEWDYINNFETETQRAIRAVEKNSATGLIRKLNERNPLTQIQQLM